LTGLTAQTVTAPSVVRLIKSGTRPVRLVPERRGRIRAGCEPNQVIPGLHSRSRSRSCSSPDSRRMCAPTVVEYAQVGTWPAPLRLRKLRTERRVLTSGGAEPTQGTTPDPRSNDQEEPWGWPSAPPRIESGTTNPSFVCVHQESSRGRTRCSGCALNSFRPRRRPTDQTRGTHALRQRRSAQFSIHLLATPTRGRPDICSRVCSRVCSMDPHPPVTVASLGKIGRAHV